MCVRKQNRKRGYMVAQVRTVSMMSSGSLNFSTRDGEGRSQGTVSLLIAKKCQIIDHKIIDDLENMGAIIKEGRCLVI